MESSRVDQALVLILELPGLDQKGHVLSGAGLDGCDVALDIAPRGHDLVGLLLIKQCGALACVPGAPGQRSITPAVKDLCSSSSIDHDRCVPALEPV